MHTYIRIYILTHTHTLTRWRTQLCKRNTTRQKQSTRTPVLTADGGQNWRAYTQSITTASPGSSSQICWCRRQCLRLFFSGSRIWREDTLTLRKGGSSGLKISLCVTLFVSCRLSRVSHFSPRWRVTCARVRHSWSRCTSKCSSAFSASSVSPWSPSS